MQYFEENHPYIFSLLMAFLVNTIVMERKKGNKKDPEIGNIYFHENRI